MHPIEILRIFLDSPFGLVIYEPLMTDGQVNDLRLVWHNPAAQELIALPLADKDGQLLSSIASDRWDALKERFNRLVTTGKPFSYAHEVDGFMFIATVWYSPPYIAIKVRETSREGINIEDAKELGTTLRMLGQRTKDTLDLASLLATQRVGSED